MTLGTVLVRYRQGETWFDGTLELSGPETVAEALRMEGTDGVVALRDLLNTLISRGASSAW